MKILKNELKNYYRGLWTESAYCSRLKNPDWKLQKSDGENFSISYRIMKEMDEFYEKNPKLSAFELKAELHEKITELFEPQIFPHSPFYFEMGIRPADNWGTPYSKHHAGAWLYNKKAGMFQDNLKDSNILEARVEHGLDRKYGIVDCDHFCPPYTRVLEKGVLAIIEEVRAEPRELLSKTEKIFLESCLRSLKCLLKASEKFAGKAAELYKKARDARSEKFLSMIERTAKKVPAQPPRNYYEALAAMCFLREATASFEGIGLSVMGHPDRLLEKFYKRDIESQTLSRKEAADLSARWMLPCDVRFEVEYNKWPETSSTLMLGGRGQEGAPVFNEITKNFLEAHKKYNLINPKLNCRFNSETPEAYLREISRQIISGRNVFALLNDDCIIEANVKAGRAVEDCRLYTAGGCQEIIIEGMEHSAAAYYYFNLPRALTLFLYDRENAIKTGMKAEFKDYRNFQSLYDDALSFTGKLISQGASLRVSAGRAWPEVNPCPLFSSMMNECVKKHRDFTQGGTKYSPSGISLVGFGTFVDSLYALKKLCFEEKIVTFGDFRKILASNWKGMESLRVQAVKVEKYGHNRDAPDRIATETVGRISEICSRLENERGGHFQPSFFAYYLFARMAPETPATPDGRKAGELLSQGIAPGCLKKAESFSDAVMTLGKIDFTEVPGSSVLDVQLPSGTVNSENLVSLIKTFGKIKGPILQPGAVSVEELRDAVKNPEKHKNLTVRISGLSARFISLDGDVQKEIINRNMMS